jgi:hypothetical protein
MKLKSSTVKPQNEAHVFGFTTRFFPRQYHSNFQCGQSERRKRKGQEGEKKTTKSNMEARFARGREN